MNCGARKASGWRNRRKLFPNGQTECFTMSGTALDKLKMDNKLLSPSSAEPETPATAGDAKAGAASPLHNTFVGPDGIYAFPRWLIYLAMAWIVFQVERWLLASIEPHVKAVWWPMMIEG